MLKIGVNSPQKKTQKRAQKVKKSDFRENAHKASKIAASGGFLPLYLYSVCNLSC